MDVKHIKFQTAQRFKIKSGKYKGQTIDKIAETDEGLKYLDNLAGFIEDGALKRILEIYLGDKAIQEELRKIK